MNMSDSRNVEIKAKIIDIEYVTDLAKDLTQSNGVIINQRDTFFKSEQGRLKMRLFEVSKIIYNFILVMYLIVHIRLRKSKPTN